MAAVYCLLLDILFCLGIWTMVVASMLVHVLRHLTESILHLTQEHACRTAFVERR